MDGLIWASGVVHFWSSWTSPRPGRIATVREAITMIRQLWRGDKIPFMGEVFRATEAAQLQWTPTRADMPVMVGTWGVQMSQMAGGVADEVKAGSMWSAAYGRHMWAHIKAGARTAGRDPQQVGLVFGPLTAISEDREQAKAYARRTLGVLPAVSCADAGVYRYGRGSRRTSAGGNRTRRYRSTGLAEISDEILGNFALYGTPHDVIEGIERMVSETAVTRVEFGMPHGPNGSLKPSICSVSMCCHILQPTRNFILYRRHHHEFYRV